MELAPMEIQNAKSLAAFLKKRRKYLEKKKTILINLSDIKVKTFPKKAIDLPSSFMGFARQIKHQIRSCLLSREVFTENYPVDSHVIKFYEYYVMTHVTWILLSYVRLWVKAINFVAGQFDWIKMLLNACKQVISDCLLYGVL